MTQEKKHDEVYKVLKESGAEGWGGTPGQSRQSSWNKILKEVFDKIILSGNKVLELGAGAGDASILLAQQGFEVTGVEFSETAVKWAKEKAENLNLKIRFLYSDVTDSELLVGEVFDFILDGNCLHCLFGDQRVQFYENVKRLLATGGYLYISSVIKKHQDDMPTRVGPLDRYFITQEELKDEIEKTGMNLMDYWVYERENHSHFCGIISN